MMRCSLGRLLLLGLPCWLALACQDDSGGRRTDAGLEAGPGLVGFDGGAAGGSVTAKIGRDGGVLTLAGFRLTIPAGAIAEPTKLTVSIKRSEAERALPSSLYSPVFAVAPYALRLAKPGLVEIDVLGDPVAPVLGWIDGSGQGHVLASAVASGSLSADIAELGLLVVVDAAELAEDSRFARDPIVVALLRGVASELDAGVSARDASAPGIKDPGGQDAPDGAAAVPPDGGLGATLTPCLPGQYLDPLLPGRCGVCPQGTFSVRGDAEGCEAWTSCAAGEVVLAEPSVTSDRMCQAPQRCQPGTYVLSPAVGAETVSCAACAPGTFSAVVNAESCSPWASCGDGQYELQPGTATADRACAGVATCGPGEFVEVAATSTTDASCGACAAGTFSSAMNSAACAPWAPCGNGRYEVTAPSAVADRVCAAAGECPPGTFVATAAGAGSDVQCDACPDGTFTVTSNADACEAWSACAEDEHESAAPSATSDRSCAGLGACGPGQYVVGQDDLEQPICASCAAGSFSDSENAEQCTPFTVCTVDQYQQSAPTAAADRACAPLTICPSGALVSSASTATRDRQCTDCVGGFSTGPNAEACTPWSNCAPGSVVTVGPSAAQDRQCEACPRGTQSISENATQCVPNDFMQVDTAQFALQTGWRVDAGETMLTSENGAVTSYTLRAYQFYDTDSGLETGDIHGRGVAADDEGASAWIAYVYTPVGAQAVAGTFPVIGLEELANEPPEAFVLIYAAVGSGNYAGVYISASGELTIELVDGALAVGATDVVLEGVTQDQGARDFEGFYLLPQSTPITYAFGPHYTGKGVALGKPAFTAAPAGGDNIWRYAYTGETLWAVGSQPPRGGVQALYDVDTATGLLTTSTMAAAVPEWDFAAGSLWGYARGGSSLVLFDPKTAEPIESRAIDVPYPPLRGFSNDGQSYWWIGTNAECEPCRALVSKGVDSKTDVTLTDLQIELDDLVYGGGALWLSAGRGNILELDTGLNLLDVYHVTDYEKLGAAEGDSSIVMQLEYIDGALWVLDQQNNFYRLDITAASGRQSQLGSGAALSAKQ